MICKECQRELREENRLHYINNNWYFIPTFVCDCHGMAIKEKDIVPTNIVVPNKAMRKHMTRGLHVNIVLKKDQKTGILTEGYIKDVLTNSKEHWRGIKVRLEDGQVGRVQEILPP